MPFEQPIKPWAQYCTITAFIAQLVGNAINTSLAYIMLCWKHLQLVFVVYMKMSLTLKYNEEQWMPKTRRSEEPFYEPSVDASTEAEGRHSKSVQESEVH